MLLSTEQEIGRLRSGLSYCEHEINKLNEALKELKEQNEILKKELADLKSEYLLDKEMNEWTWGNKKPNKWKNNK